MAIIRRHRQGRDAENLRPSAGWDLEVLDLEPKAFACDERHARVPGSFEISRRVIRGRVRMSAALGAPKLQISLVKAGPPFGARLQGRSGLNAAVLISAEGNRWDCVTQLGIDRIDVEFEEPLARGILGTGAARDALSGNGPSALTRYGRAAKRLEAAAERILDAGENDPAAKDPALAGLEPSGELVEAAVSVLEEASRTTRIPGRNVGSPFRSTIALEVEKRLWRTLSAGDGRDALTLEALEESLGASRRTIQSAVQEQLGVTFSELKRLIRLTQVRRAILRTEGRIPLGFIAAEYGLHAGRLAKEYSDLFGTRPSEEKARFAARYRSLVMPGGSGRQQRPRAE